MSAIGTKRTWPSALQMSAFEGKADIGSSHDAAAEQRSEVICYFSDQQSCRGDDAELLDLSLLPSYLKSISASGDGGCPRHRR